MILYIYNIFMSGGLMQLVAYGAQDVYLTGNPQVTFFKAVYRRYTNFAIESIEQTVNGEVQLGKKFSVTIARNGDLVNRVYLEIEWQQPAHDACAAGKRSSGFDLLEYVEVEIGGQCIDKQYGEWMTIWCDLTHTTAQKSMLNRGLLWDMLKDTNSPPVTRSYIPLQFWFCRNPGLSLPLIALQYHEVKLNIQMSKSCCENGCCNSCDICNLFVYCDYIFLDTDERRRFAQVSHEYLIEQVQYSNNLPIKADACNISSELHFNHPVKELMWVIQNNCTVLCDDDACEADSSGCGECCEGTDDRDAPLGAFDSNFIRANTCVLQLNGQDRFRKRQGDYFTDIQRYEHHTGGFVRRIVNVPEYVHLYSFALKPEEHQPSGTCNFSRIDNAVLVQTIEAPVAPTSEGLQLRIYAVNYNVLRIMSGMGGLAYSN
jgi:hypothetical protein